MSRPVAQIVHELSLDLSEATGSSKGPEKIAGSLSGVAVHGSHLFVGSDEGWGFERLTRREGTRYEHAQSFPLGDLFEGLAGDEEDEADVESLALDGDWLWLVTSHARTRGKLPAKLDTVDAADIEEFARVEFHERRYVLGRVPLLVTGKPTPTDRDGRRRAWCLPKAKSGNALTRALKRDPHLAHSLRLPAKENGLDIEGLAVRGDRVVLGLRGPVLRGMAVLLDLRWSEEGDLGLTTADGGSVPKIFLDLDGLGVRDLCVRGEDLLLLAGPTMTTPVPFRIYILSGFFGGEAEPIYKPAYLCDLPQLDGRNPEGLTPYGEGDNEFLLIMDGDKAAAGTKAFAYVVRVP